MGNIQLKNRKYRPPLIGQSDALNYLHARLTNTGLTFICAAPLMGKTYLLDVFKERLIRSNDYSVGCAIGNIQESIFLSAMADMYGCGLNELTKKQQWVQIKNSLREKWPKMALKSIPIIKQILSADTDNSSVYENLGVEILNGLLNIKRRHSKEQTQDYSIANELARHLHGLNQKPQVIIMDAFDQLTEPLDQTKLIKQWLESDQSKMESNSGWPSMHIFVSLRALGKFSTPQEQEVFNWFQEMRDRPGCGYKEIKQWNPNQQEWKNTYNYVSENVNGFSKIVPDSTTFSEYIELPGMIYSCLRDQPTREADLRKIKNNCINWSEQQFFKGSDNKKEMIINESGLKRHLLETKKRCAMVRTLARTAPYKIEDIYIPLTLSGHEQFYMEDSVKFIKCNPRSVIVDHAGMGKSTLAKKIVFDLSKKGNYVPFLFEMRSFEKEYDFINHIYRFARAISHKNSNIINSIFVVFDGIDEIVIDGRESVIHSIHEFLENTNFSCLITSRNSFEMTSMDVNKNNDYIGHEAWLKKAKWNRISVFHMLPLKKSELLTLLDKFGESTAIRKLKQSLSDPQNTDILKYLERPLFVALLYRAYEFEGRIPSKPHLFYESVFNSLFSHHDLSKADDYKHPRKADLDSAQLHKILRCFAILCIYKGFKIEFSETEFSIMLGEVRDKVTTPFNVDHLSNDLLMAVPLMIKIGNNVNWIHKSMLEYFAARYINDDTGNDKPKLIRVLIEKNPELYDNLIQLLSDIDGDSYELATDSLKVLVIYANFRNKLRKYWPNIEENLFDFVAFSLYGHSEIRRGKLVRNSDLEPLKIFLNRHKNFILEGKRFELTDNFPNFPTLVQIPNGLYSIRDWKILESYAIKPSIGIGGIYAEKVNYFPIYFEIEKYIKILKCKEKNQEVFDVIGKILNEKN
jgi:NACHT domain